jgi:ATP-dependent Zn protease
VLCIGALCSKYARALTFQKKNEQAQYDLGLEQKDFVPVVYSNETSWAQELLKFAPTLLIIGVWLFVMRQMGGAKKRISKITGTFSQYMY